MEAALYGPQGRIVLSATPLKIGRAPDNQLVLSDGKTSTHHAEIRPDGQGYSIIDVGSTNGTFVNEERLERNRPRLLRAGDIIRIGDVRMSYEVSGAEVAPTVYAAQSTEMPPTVAAPQPEPQGYPAYPLPQVPPVPPPPYPPPPNPTPYNVPYPPPNYVVAPAPVQPQKTDRRRTWLIVGIVAAVVVLACVLASALGAIFGSTPTKTLTTFCNDVVNDNFSDAYQQLSSGFQSKVSETEFDTEMQQITTASGGMRSCTVGNVSDNGSTGNGVVTWMTNASPQPIISSFQLVDENGSWKISGGVIFRNP